MNIEEFKTKYPDLHHAIFEDGKKEGHAAGLIEGETAGLEKGKTEAQDQAKEAGAKAEMERIQSVEAQSIPGHEKLIQALKFDSKTTGPEAAVQILAAEKTLRQNVLSQLDTDAPDPVAHVTVPEVEDTPAKDFETLVSEYQEKNNCSRGKAISAVARAHPKAHASYLDKINKGGK